MPSIRDLVDAIRQREGVDAAVVLGRDGLVIDGQSIPGLDVEDLAARIPAIVSPADELGSALGRGVTGTLVIEHDGGMALISSMSSDALLLVLVSANANVGQLLHELRRNRQHIAALV
jgi:uncharacterized protein